MTARERLLASACMEGFILGSGLNLILFHSVMEANILAGFAFGGVLTLAWIHWRMRRA